MLITKAIKLRLYSSQEKQYQINQIREICLWLYNFLGKERIKAWKENKTIITYSQQQNILPQLKETYPDLKLVHSQTLQDVVRRLDYSWKKFYVEVRKEKVGLPRRKWLEKYESFSYTQNPAFQLKRSQLWLSKLGWMNIRKHREPIGEIKTCSLLVKNQKYYAVFSCEIEAQPKIEVSSIPKERQIGIDVGIGKDNFFALSNREKQTNPQFYRTAEKELGELQRKVSNKEKGSQRREKAKLELSKKHEKVSNQRKDFVFKAVKKLRDNYDLLAVEKLRTRKIMERNQEQNPWYSAKSLHDASLSFFLLALSHRVEETGGRLVKVNPAYTSQRCSNCQQLASRKLELSDRVFVCAWCQRQEDRDINAAKNILYQAQITELGTNFVNQGKIW
ncbi:transposase [endosymbiont DhMRE of Dentiscutata heterogama]|uniref:RNA-guided endonuclease InsQ/TnpB family protein n=1 Tax=endosymbiont DhMRE of Dentiscutata heterogama TaxID=1609546 RepID=UPI002AD2DF5A|nr:transposase [endosymbiont DhMRE of Dentiscutata heterogama]